MSVMILDLAVRFQFLHMKILNVFDKLLKMIPTQLMMILWLRLIYRVASIERIIADHLKLRKVVLC